jgi:hypothetical protein
MPSAERPVPPISIIVSWRKTVPATLAQRLFDKLLDAGLSATWAIESPAQVESLKAPRRAGVVVEAALLAPPDTGDLGKSLEQDLASFRRANQPIAAIKAGISLPRGAYERQLCQAGAKAIVSSPVAGRSSAVRPLPLGIWEFRPHICAPTARHWLRPFGRRASCLVDAAAPSPALASIDLSEIGSSRHWRDVERLVHGAAASCQRGAARSLTVAELAGELSEATAVRPQRSILRMAA